MKPLQIQHKETHNRHHSRRNINTYKDNKPYHTHKPMHNDTTPTRTELTHTYSPTTNPTMRTPLRGFHFDSPAAHRAKVYSPKPETALERLKVQLMSHPS